MNTKELVDGRFDMLHTPPKPSIWKGIHRKTKRAFFDTSGTRNTAIIVAQHDYIVFVDDLSAVHPGWRDYHQKAADKGWVFCGAYQSARNLKVLPDGQIYYSRMEDGRAHETSTDRCPYPQLRVVGIWVQHRNPNGMPT